MASSMTGRALGVALSVTAGLLGSTAMAAPVTTEDLLHAQDNAGEWLMYGRDYRNQRFSPLAQITPDNVKQLRPAWAFSTGGQFAGLEATPLYRDGVLYISADYSRVFAIDARTGSRLWSFEPEYPDGLDAKLCCGPVNRGVSLMGDLVYVNTLDAKLYALSRKDGSVVWQQTIDDWKNAVTATGAPLVVKDEVIVGIAGGEYGVRGYIKAYDAKTGKLRWQTYTIPGPGEPGNDTWPDDTWKHGGAATWQPGAYDPDTDTLFWGTGNPGPWNSDLRKGDNLWSSSLLALEPETGKIKWGYQYTPNDAWDYDGNNGVILLDTTVDGRPVKAAVQSNRNGFFYVLDRTNGQFVYAVPTVEGINWTKGLDPKTGRPEVDESKRPTSGGPKVEPIVPGLEGGTNWFPMAYNPNLGYVYFATNHWAMALTGWAAEKVDYVAGEPYMGVDYQMYRLGPDIGAVKAFDVANKTFVWSTPSPLPLFSGLLATQGGLVFTGDQQGFIQALDGKTGEVLWKFQTGSGINASPISYELDGTQYVAILSGLGGDPSFYYKAPKGGMLWVFALGGPGGNAAAAAGVNPVPIEGALPTFGK
jgi:alcohol dehydrogenase (cytochrome c)